MLTSLRRRLATLTGAGAVAAALVVTTPGLATAAPPPDYNGSRISWPSVYQCWDGSGGAQVHAQPLYDVRSTGHYGVQMLLMTSDTNRVLDYTAFTRYTRTASPIDIRFPLWSDGIYSYTGDVVVVAYVYKWNGSAYGLVAREYLPCW